MPSPSDHGLRGVAETLLIPVYVRAAESRRHDPLLRDVRAEALVAERAADFARIARIRMDESDRVALVLRNLELDRQVRDFLSRHDDAMVVHLGCGLDQRFERVDDGQVEWYDLDLPEVIELRRELLHPDAPRYHLLAASVLETWWPDAVAARGRPVLLVAEGLLMYFEAAQVRQLIRLLRARFPGAELVFDVFSPFLVRADNLKLRLSHAGLQVRYHWGLRDPAEVERWAGGIRLLDQWWLLEQREPRLGGARRLRRVPALAHLMGILRYQLGEPGYRPG